MKSNAVKNVTCLSSLLYTIERGSGIEVPWFKKIRNMSSEGRLPGK